MNWEEVTAIFSVSVAVVVIIYDVVAAYRGGWEATVSRVILNKSKVWPLIPLLFGMLMGHLFWSQDTCEDNKVEINASSRR